MATRLLIITSSVGPIGRGVSGGVEITLHSIIAALQEDLSTDITVLAHESSLISSTNIHFHPVQGTFSKPLQSTNSENTIFVNHGDLLLNMISEALKIQSNFDLIINLSYDYLLFWFTFIFTTPIVHLVSMCNEHPSVQLIIKNILKTDKASIAFHTLAQCRTYTTEHEHILYNGFDTSKYQFYSTPKPGLVWAGRISVEKGLEEAIEICLELELPLTIMGKSIDPHYENAIRASYPSPLITWLGYHTHNEFQKTLGQWQAMIFTPVWEEAMGNCLIEALLTGTPVVAYKKGGIKEVVEQGVTGFVATHNTREEIKTYIQKAFTLSREDIRKKALQKFSLNQFRSRLISWLGNTAPSIIS